MIALEYDVFKDGKPVKKITTLCRDKECAEKHKKAIIRNNERNFKFYTISEIREKNVEVDVYRINSKIQSIIVDECI